MKQVDIDAITVGIIDNDIDNYLSGIRETFGYRSIEIDTQSFPGYVLEAQCTEAHSVSLTVHTTLEFHEIVAEWREEFGEECGRVTP